MVQWLGLGAFTAVHLGSIPVRGTEILQAKLHGQSKKKKKKRVPPHCHWPTLHIEEFGERCISQLLLHNKLPQMQQIKATLLYYFTVSEGQESRHSLAGPVLQGFLQGCNQGVS